MEKGERAAGLLSGDVEVMELDLADLAGVHRFANRLAESDRPLDSW